MPICDLLTERLEKQKYRNTYRTLKTTSATIDFTSNDYLGFARSLELKQAFSNTLDHAYSLGSTGSRLLTGQSLLADHVEQYIAAYHHRESALIFNSGYTANLGLISALASQDDRVIHDVYIHASIHDGIRLSKAQSIPFRHNDIEHLEKRLSQPHCGQTFVCVESVYSLHGSVSPLKTICELCKKYSAHLIVDEAHSIGVFGDKGEGLVSTLGLQNDVAATVYTFGKALGIHGAAVVGSSLLKDYLINFSRPFIYTTALPPHAFTMIHLAYQYNENATISRENLQELIAHFRENARSMQLPILQDNANTPIQSLCIPGSTQVRNAANKLQNSGFDVRPIVSPTVKQKEELLRICLHAFNTKSEITEFLNKLYEIQESLCILS
ncbi:pyridoxal phosphate-dependent aminotransferase family protein [Chlamydia crocodili]|uniref:Pyridoxal phosphate-dependent aminotransferase family protein n=1 Tax=Chlamydia crocodili TaxID=2766982 RepID=A0ABX8CI31_9CHLA|nr:pyridoxal phosphate-dependent aminotransferase family protein [Chlamydia crocodili]QVE49247.1 pyridoxal phosphate-dependent aminotransferase family protein [Chlamydia crocodili]